MNRTRHAPPALLGIVAALAVESPGGVPLDALGRSSPRRCAD
jgi:hypothetical protein